MPEARTPDIGLVLFSGGRCYFLCLGLWPLRVTG